MNAAVRRTVASVLGVDASSVLPSTSPQDIEEWDSARHIELVLALEEALGVRFEPDEISAMTDVSAIDSLVARKLGT